MAKTKTISVTFRCPEDLYNALSNFALDHNIIKEDKPIISEALIAALRIGLGTGRNTDVSQSVRQPDFEAMITDAIAPLLARIETLEAISREATPSEKKPLIQASITEHDAPPIIEAIAQIEAASIQTVDTETSTDLLQEEMISTSSKIKKPAKTITYNLADDGSVVLRSLKGTDSRTLKKMSDEQLQAIGFKKKDDKIYPIAKPN